MTAEVVEIRPGAAGKRRRQVRATENDPPWLAAISSPSGAIAPTSLNLITILSNDERWSGVLAWDDLDRDLRKMAPPPWPEITRATGAQAGRWESTDSTRLTAWFTDAYEMRVGEDAAYKAARVVAERKRIHPIRDWLDGLTYTPAPEPRIDTWAIRYLGAPDTPYTRTVSRWFLLSAVARIYEPGCKVDTMLILEGDQGLRKSSAMHALFGERWSSDTPPDLHSKDRFGAVRGIWLLEFAELDSFGKADAARVKAFVSSRTDRYRPPYERLDVEVPRSCVFVGSVNPNGRGYFLDETGNRRFWPLKCRPCGSGIPLGQLDIAGIREAREAIWAEAREAYNPKGTEHARWWPETRDEHSACGVEQEERVAGDVWEEPITRFLRGPLSPLKRSDPFVTLGTILGDALGIEPAKQDQQAQNRAARVMVILGWRKCQKREEDGSRTRGYRPAGWSEPG